MPHNSSHVIISSVVDFAKNNKYSILACVASFIAGALIF